MGDRPAIRDWRFWGLLGGFAILLALQLATPRLDSDQAVTGLMGVHILQGEFPIFFWSQDHAGVPESYGAAAVFFLLGVSRLTLSLVPALTAMGLAVALYRTGAVLFGHSAGLLAILFATLVSPYVAAHYVLARAYYVEHLLAGQIILLGAALWLRRRLGRAAQARVLVAMGLAGGVGLYCGFQIVGPLLPATLALLLAEPWLPLQPRVWLGVGAFLLGSAPFWVYNLTHDWATFATGTRFEGGQSAGAAATALYRDLLPVVLGAQDYIGTPSYLPGPLGLAAPAIVAAAAGLLAVRVTRGFGRIRQDPSLAGEALLLTTTAAMISLVWYGRFVQVPRYLVPLAPVLALILARATQLVWRRTRVGAIAGVALYGSVVGVGLARDVTILSPARRADYQAAQADDQALLGFLRARSLSLAYSPDYWLALRLTFDARERPIVAEPFNGRYPPYTRAVDASRAPAYVFRGRTEGFEQWLRAIGTSAARARTGSYTVFWDFSPPAPVVPVPRAGWIVRLGPGAAEPGSLTDARLDSGWSSAPGPPGSAWVEVDLGTRRSLAGVTLVTDQPDHLPRALEVAVDDGPALRRTVARVETGGVTVAWRNGAPRISEGRTLAVRFAPVETRRLRLTDLGPAGTWAVSELFLLAPGSGTAASPIAVQEGDRLEAGGAVGPALTAYREAMTGVQDDPEGAIELARLAAASGLDDGPLAERAVRYARLGWLAEARRMYTRLAAELDPGLSYAELTRRRVDLAVAAGDFAEARRLQAEADSAPIPPPRALATFGRILELVTYATPARAHPGEPLALAYRWRLLGQAPARLVAYVHFEGEHARFDDDHPLPAPIPGLDDGPQHALERRRLVIPPDIPPGRYRVTLGVWQPESGRRLRRWWGGVLPMPGHTVELGFVDVMPRS